MTNFHQALTPDTLFARETLWQSWLDVEATLATVQGEIGMIPAWAAKDIAAAAKLEKIGVAELEADTRRTMAPILSLTRLLVKASGKAGDYVHWGATTQNVQQTGRILLIREADTAIRQLLGQCLSQLSTLARDHADTVMVGRTNRQHALPITFGFKVAGWIEEITRALDRLSDGGGRLFALPFGGAVGAMHAFGDHGRTLNQAMAKKLGLSELLVPGRAVNDLFADYILQLCMLAMTIERMMSELYLLMTQEIGEVVEILDAGTMGSSTMPQKVNPKFVVRVIAEAAELRGFAGPVLETGRSTHEGDSAANQLLASIIERSVPLAWRMAANTLETLKRIAPQPNRMAENFARSNGAIATERLMMQLAPHVGREKAHDIIHHILEASIGPDISPIEAISNDPQITSILSTEEVHAALDAQTYCGDSADIALKAAALADEKAAEIAGSKSDIIARVPRGLAI